MRRIASILLISIALLPGLFLTTSRTAYGQDSSPLPDPSRIETDIRYLASDTLGGRLAGTPEADQAALYVIRAFKSAGLQPVNWQKELPTFLSSPSGNQIYNFDDLTNFAFTQDFQFIGNVSLGSKNDLVVHQGDGEQPLEAGKDYTPLYMSCDGSAYGDVVFAGYGITAPDYKWDDYANLDVKGKIVLCLRNEPRADDPASPFDGQRPTIYAGLPWKAENAIKHGAIALMVVTGPANIKPGEEDKLLTLDNHYSLHETQIPIVQLSQESAAKLWEGMDAPLSVYQSEMDKHMMGFGAPLKGVSVSLDVLLNRQISYTRNVIGVLRGSDPALRDQYVIVGAHYDHIGMGGPVLSMDKGGAPAIHPGADDDASGTAAVMELARLTTQNPASFGRSILFVCFSGEELGLLGSTYYMENPLVPLDKTVAMINLDMVGRVRPDDKGNPISYIYGMGTASEWKDIFPETSPDAKLHFSLISDQLAGGDYVPFYRNRIPDLDVTSGSHEEMHTPRDTADLINFDGEASLVGTIYEVVMKLANAPVAPAFTGTVQQAPSSGETGMPSYTVYLGTIPDFTRTGGFWISGVKSGSPAEKAGLKGGDQITKVGDYAVTNIQDYTEALKHFSPGDTTSIVVYRDGIELTLSVTFGDRSKS